MINGPGGLRKGPLPICQRLPVQESIDHFWAFFQWFGVGSSVVKPSQWSLKEFIGFAATKLTSGLARIGL